MRHPLPLAHAEEGATGMWRRLAGRLVEEFKLVDCFPCQRRIARRPVAPWPRRHRIRWLFRSSLQYASDRAILRPDGGEVARRATAPVVGARADRGTQGRTELETGRGRLLSAEALGPADPVSARARSKFARTRIVPTATRLPSFPECRIDRSAILCSA